MRRRHTDDSTLVFSSCSGCHQLRFAPRTRTAFNCDDIGLVVVQRNEGRQASGGPGYWRDKDKKRWENTKYRVWFVRRTGSCGGTGLRILRLLDVVVD